VPVLLLLLLLLLRPLLLQLPLSTESPELPLLPV